MQRRTLLTTGSALLTTAIAGCSGDGGNGNGGDADAQATPEDTENSNDTGGSSDETEESTPTGTPEQKAEPEREAVGYPSDYIEVHDVSWNSPENDYSGPFVEGVADNVSGEELSYVEVQIQAFNSDDTQIGEAMDNTSDLRAEKSWQFKCEFFDVDEDEIAYWMGRAEVQNY